MENMENPIEKKINKMNDALTKELELLMTPTFTTYFYFATK